MNIPNKHIPTKTLLHFALLLCITFCVKGCYILRYRRYYILRRKLLHFALLLHFVAKVITFCVTITFVSVITFCGVTGALANWKVTVEKFQRKDFLNSFIIPPTKKYRNSQSIGTHLKGSKLDVIMQIKQAISKDNEKFKKAFNRIWGRSGGWVSGTCQHGAIHALKFVLCAESPRNYIDLILSMAHQPNIVVSDTANMLVAHGQKRNRDMFGVHNGMVAEPTCKRHLKEDWKYCCHG